MFKRKKEEAKVEAPALPEPPKFDRKIMMEGGKARISCFTHIPSETRARADGYPPTMRSILTEPAAKCGGSWRDLQDFINELAAARDEALRLEGAVASLYPGK